MAGDKDMTDEAPTDLNVLMSLDPLNLTRQDRNAIVTYQRKQRAAREAGGKTKRVKEGTPSIDIKALLGTVPKASPSGPTIRRRL